MSESNVLPMPYRANNWAPGKSGNPSGVSSRVLRARSKCRKYAAGKSLYAMQKLAALLESEDERVVYMAATAILDRAGIRANDVTKPGDTDRSALGYVLVPVKDTVATDAPANTLPRSDGG